MKMIRLSLRYVPPAAALLAVALSRSMHTVARNLIITSIGLAVGCSTAANAQSSLNGSTVTVAVVAPNSTTIGPAGHLRNVVVQSTSPEISCPGSNSGGDFCNAFPSPAQVSIQGLSIVFTGGPILWDAVPYNGIGFFGLNFGDGSALTGFTLTTNLPGLSKAAVTFTSNSIQFNAEGLLSFSNYFIKLDLCTSKSLCITNPHDGASPSSQFVAISGTGTAGDTLAVLVNNAPIGSNGVVVDSEGNWEALAFIGSAPLSATVQVQDNATNAFSNTITVASQLTYSSQGPTVPADPIIALLPLRHADIFVTASASSPQYLLYGPSYTHTALYLGGDANGTPLIAEAVTPAEAGSLGQVRSVPLEQSTVWTGAIRMTGWHPQTPLPGATSDAIVAWTLNITSQVPSLPYWNPVTDFAEPILGADLLFVATGGNLLSLPANFNRFLNELNNNKNSTSKFICSTLVWRAYYEGTGHTLDISNPNNMTATAGSILGNLNPLFRSVFIQELDPVLVVPQTFVTSPLLKQIF
jgi:hypothetical protein